MVSASEASSSTGTTEGNFKCCISMLVVFTLYMISSYIIKKTIRLEVKKIGCSLLKTVLFLCFYTELHF